MIPPDSQISLMSSTVLAVNNCIRHDSTSYTVLKCVEAEFGCGMCRCDTGTQCWVHKFNVEAAHFGPRVLKRKPPGEGATPNRTEIWLFEGVKVDKIGWNFHGTIWTQRQTFSRGMNPPGPLALWASMQKPHVWVKRLLRSVKQEKESDGVTIWQVNKTHRQHSGHLMPMILPRCCSVTWWHSIERRQFRSWPFRSSFNSSADAESIGAAKQTVVLL